MPPKCPCSWADCVLYEKTLKESGPPQYRGSPQCSNRIRIRYTPGSAANKGMRDAIHFCLRTPMEVREKNAEYFIARHHFCQPLLEHLLDDEYKRLKSRLTTPIPSSVANDSSIRGKIFMAPSKHGAAGKKDPNLFLAVPNNGLAEVKVMVCAAESARSGRVENMSSRRDLLENSNNINTSSPLNLRHSSSCVSSASPSVSSIGPESSGEAR